MAQANEDYRATLTRALGGRSVAGSATAHGLPRDAIRRVLQGHDPQLSRADDICRAVGITFTLGLPRDDLRSGKHAIPRIRDSEPPAGTDAAPSGRPESIPTRDALLADLLARVTDHWEHLDAYERERLAAGLVSILDLVGAIGRRG